MAAMSVSTLHGMLSCKLCVFVSQQVVSRMGER